MSRHPLLVQLEEICNSNGIDKHKAFTAFDLYMELCEVQKLWEVKYHFNEEMKLFYLKAKQKKDSSEFNVYVPVTAEDVLGPEYFELLQQKLSPDEHVVILALRDQDSSSTQYRVTKGLVRPDSPETAQLKKQDENRSWQFQKHLARSRKRFFANAFEQGQYMFDAHSSCPE